MSKSQRVILRMTASLVLPGLLIMQPVAAAESAPSVTVRYHDLNLSNPEGSATLYKRIHNAAVEVCVPLQGPRAMNGIFRTSWEECVDRAVSNAVKSVNNASLDAYLSARLHASKGA